MGGGGGALALALTLQYTNVLYIIILKYLLVHNPTTIQYYDFTQASFLQ